MKINQVEELVGVTKKNIRFYEDQGLLNPSRDPENGYREYSLADVDELMKVKFLRKIGVPIEDIRKIQNDALSITECLDRQSTNLHREIRSIEAMEEMCEKLKTDNLDYKTMKASVYLDEIRILEEGGRQFMDIANEDVKKKKSGALIAAIVFCSLILFYGVVVICAGGFESMPIGIALFLGGISLALIIGCIIALVQRMKELDGGEENEASKY